MNRTLIGIVLTLLSATASPATAAAAEEPDDLKQLAGSWKPKEANLGDNKIDSMVLEKAVVAYEGDKYTITIGEK
jgi:hypothetical protein